MKRIGYLFLAAILGAIVGLLSAMLLTAFIPACGEDCVSQALATLMYCVAGGMALFVGTAAVSARRAIPPARQGVIGGLVLAVLCLLPSLGYYVLTLQSECRTAKAAAPVAPDADFPHMAIATRPVQSWSDARRGPVRPGEMIGQWEKCLIGTARCDASPRQAEMRCHAGIVYVDESNWPAFSLIPKEDAPGISPLKSMRLCNE